MRKRKSGSAAGRRLGAVHPGWRAFLQCLPGLRLGVLPTLLLMLLMQVPAAYAGVSATVDRRNIAMGETLMLVIASDAAEDPAATDLSPLERDFDILQRSSSSSMQIINGQSQRSRELRLELLPQREGTVQIPPLDVDGVRTEAIQIEVSAAPPAASADQDVIFSAEVDTDSVYVQQQVVLTLRVEQAINLDERSVSELELEQDAFITPLGQNSYQRNSGGKRWLVNELRFAIFPQQSGTLTIPAQTFVARERRPSRSLFDLSSGPRLQRRSQPIEIAVKPRPATFPGTDWLPAQQLSIEEQWSEDPEQLAVGQSLTRTVIVRAQGLQGAQLPPLLFSPQQGLKYYPDQPSIEDSESDQGVIGMRVDSAALVPVQPGSYALPEVRIPWWDTSTDSLRYATLPARTLRVSAAPQAAGSGVADTDPAPGATGPAEPSANRAGLEGSVTDTTVNSTALRSWQLATAVCAAGWLLSTLLWWRRRARSQPSGTLATGPGGHTADSEDEKAAWRQLREACTRRDASGAHRALQQWLRQCADYRRAENPRQYVSRRQADALLQAMDTLERTLYAAAADRASWDGRALLQAAEALRATNKQRGTGDRGNRAGELAPLYPQTAGS
jgi:hypothetical protein